MFKPPVLCFPPPRLSLLRSTAVLALAFLLAACDQLGIETPAQTTARQEAEGKAVGGACRHAGRALEDCYKSSPKTSKAAIYTGWRDMDAYMRENKIDVVVTAETAAAMAEQKSGEHAVQDSAAPADGENPADSSTSKPAAKSGKQS